MERLDDPDLTEIMEEIRSRAKVPATPEELEKKEMERERASRYEISGGRFKDR